MRRWRYLAKGALLSGCYAVTTAVVAMLLMEMGASEAVAAWWAAGVGAGAATCLFWGIRKSARRKA